jgi:nicotinamide-nucleotide amidase
VSDGTRTDVLVLDLPGDRAEVRAGAVGAALEALLERLVDGNDGPSAGVTP